MVTLNGVPFRKNLLSRSKYQAKARYSMNPKKITIHNTDNQMPADNEIRYMIGNSSVVGFHIAIDEKEAVQGIPFSRSAFHAGDGNNGFGNRNTIGVEMCRNYDRSRSTTNLNNPLKTQFDKTFSNTIKVVAQLCINEGIVASVSNIKQHKNWSGKHCPSKILNDGDWNRLVNGIINEYNRLKKGGKPAKPSSSVGSSSNSNSNKKPAKTNWIKVSGNWTGQTLLRGQYGEPVRQMQTKLASNTPPFYPNKGAKNNGVDSYYGKDTEDAVRRFQEYYGLSQDGKAGKQVYAKVSKSSASSSNKTKANLSVDGKWGDELTKALQRYFSTTVDGVISYQSKNSVVSSLYGRVTYGSKGSLVIKKLQKKIGEKADGKLGRNTVVKLQKYLGTGADGKISQPTSAVVKKLQQKLNAGTF